MRADLEELQYELVYVPFHTVFNYVIEWATDTTCQYTRTVQMSPEDDTPFCQQLQ